MHNLKSNSSVIEQGKRDVIFADLVYQHTICDIKKMAKRLLPHHDILIISDSICEIKKKEYRAVVFVNDIKKEIICSVAGTRLLFNKAGVSDIIDNFRVLFSKFPLKIKSASALNNQILNVLGDKVQEYSFRYTGHSLGASMAQLSAADMEIKLAEKKLCTNTLKISCMGFDGPGIKHLLEDFYTQNNSLLASSIIQFTCFNSTANFINQMHEQVGEVYTIVPNQWYKNQKTKSKPKIYQALKRLSLIKKSTKVAKFCIKHLVPLFTLSRFIDQLRDHQLDNLKDVLLNQKGKINKIQNYKKLKF